MGDNGNDIDVADLMHWKCPKCSAVHPHTSTVTLVIRAKLNGSDPVYPSDQPIACPSCGYEVSTRMLVNAAMCSRYPKWVPHAALAGFALVPAAAGYIFFSARTATIIAGCLVIAFLLIELGETILRWREKRV